MQPLPGTHAPTVQSVSKNEQSGGDPPAHTPFEQNPLSTQLSKSVHEAPLLPGISMHLSCAVSHMAVAHCVVVEHTVGVPPAHAPEVHLSPLVQYFPSSQAVPSLIGKAAHIPLTHAP